MNPARQNRLDDLQIRLWGIPGFGILIPNFTGLFGPVGYTEPLYWFGYLYFIFISFAIWQGNRWLLFKQREHYDWFSQPASKVVMILFANVFYTSPLTVVLCLGWYEIAGVNPDWDVIRVTTLTNVIAVIFVTHIYETVFLIKERETDLLHVERLERAKSQAELEALKTQIDPHFMFNSLNTLSYLIEYDPRKAYAFTEDLADVYRYILSNRERDLVLLGDELTFLNHYTALLRRRFEDAIVLDCSVSPGDLDGYLLPPISLQILMENAIKHNIFSIREPLRVRFELRDNAIVATNAVRKRPLRKESSRVGLKNLNERYRLVVGKDILVTEPDGQFEVMLPLLSMAR